MDIPNTSEQKWRFLQHDLDFIQNDDTLYLSFIQMYSNNYLYKITSAQATPQLIWEGHNSHANEILNSETYPTQLKYFIFSPIVGGYDNWGISEVFYYLPSENKLEHIGTMADPVHSRENQEGSYIWAIPKNDIFITTEFFAKTDEDVIRYFIKQINGQKVDIVNNKIDVFPLISADQMPLCWDAWYDEKRDQLFLLGEDIYVFNFDTKELSLFFNLHDFSDSPNFDSLFQYRYGNDLNNEDCLYIYQEDGNKNWGININTKAITKIDTQ